MTLSCCRLKSRHGWSDKKGRQCRRYRRRRAKRTPPQSAGAIRPICRRDTPRYRGGCGSHVRAARSSHWRRAICRSGISRAKSRTSATVSSAGGQWCRPAAFGLSVTFNAVWSPTFQSRSPTGSIPLLRFNHCTLPSARDVLATTLLRQPLCMPVRSDPQVITQFNADPRVRRV